MQVPEKLTLIGGSILLASTLIFTLKSQASSLIPQVGHSISNVYDHIGDAQNDSEFGNGYKEAQKNGWTTGTWGTAKYYIDDKDNLYIDKGNPSGPLSDTLGNQNSSKIKQINITQGIVAPANSYNLLAAMPNLNNITGLNNVNSDNVRIINTSFAGDSSLTSLDLSNWDLSKVTDAANVFGGDLNLHQLNISKFNSAGNLGGMFDNNGLNKITVGEGFNLWGTQGLTGKWKAPDGFIGDFPGGSRPGTWVQQ